MKISTLILVPFILICFFLNYRAKPNIGELLATRLHNDLYLQFDTLAFDSVFVKELNKLTNSDVNIQKLKNFYLANGCKPNLVLRFFDDKSLDSLVKYLNSSVEHGFQPKLFHTKEIATLISKLRLNNFKSVGESYAVIARLEIFAADGYASYLNYLRFGLVDPKKLFDNFDMKLKHADSLFYSRLLLADNILDTLRASQKISPQYIALQQRYIQAENDSVKKILAVNMERLRWNLPNTGRRFIQVNIPDFRLVYFDGNDTLSTMKVCVGKPKNIDYDKKLVSFRKTGGLADKPENHETPLLFSTIKKLYTNPVWNVPESIAETEVYAMARKNPNYLKSKNIAVYYRNKIVKNPSGIRWRKYDKTKLPFLFVQQPGLDNSLGRLKFIFPNSSSVYLHDTNFKQGFKLNNRAISHGCVRIEKPLELAKLLVSDSLKFDQIRKELQLKPIYSLPEPKVVTNGLAKKDKTLSPVLFAPREETCVLITYFTAWSNNNKIEYRKDIYGMDEKLWLAMKKFR